MTLVPWVCQIAFKRDCKAKIFFARLRPAPRWGCSPPDPELRASAGYHPSKSRVTAVGRSGEQTCPLEKKRDLVSAKNDKDSHRHSEPTGPAVCLPKLPSKLTQLRRSQFAFRDARDRPQLFTVLQRTGHLFFRAPPNKKDPAISSARGGENVQSVIKEAFSMTIGVTGQGTCDRDLVLNSSCQALEQRVRPAAHSALS